MPKLFQIIRKSEKTDVQPRTDTPNADLRQASIEAAILTGAPLGSPEHKTATAWAIDNLNDFARAFDSGLIVWEGDIPVVVRGNKRIRI